MILQLDLEIDKAFEKAPTQKPKNCFLLMVLHIILVESDSTKLLLGIAFEPGASININEGGVIWVEKVTDKEYK